MTRYSSVVLAGGVAPDDFREATGAFNSAVLRVNGSLVVDTVCRALRESGCVDDLVVMGNMHVSERTRPDQGSLVDNVYAGAAAVPAQPVVLFATGDMPFLSAEAVQRFCHQAESTGADLVYPIVPLGLCEQAFPGMSRTGLRLREGRFTGGNLLIIRRTLLDHNAQTIRDAFSARKSVWKLARLFGLRTLAALAISFIRPDSLTIPQLEQAMGRLAGGIARAVVVDYPGIGVDIDRLEHVEALKSHGVQIG